MFHVLIEAQASFLWSIRVKNGKFWSIYFSLELRKISKWIRGRMGSNCMLLWHFTVKPGPNDLKVVFSWKVSSTLIYYHHLRPNKMVSSRQSVIDSYEKFDDVQSRWKRKRVDKSAWGLIWVDKSLGPNEGESLTSHQLLSSFACPIITEGYFWAWRRTNSLEMFH